MSSITSNLSGVPHNTFPDSSSSSTTTSVIPVTPSTVVPTASLVAYQYLSHDNKAFSFFGPENLPIYEIRSIAAKEFGWPINETQVMFAGNIVDDHLRKIGDVTRLRVLRKKIVNEFPNSSSSSTTTSVIPVTPPPTVVPTSSSSVYRYQFGSHPKIQFDGPRDLTMDEIRVRAAREAGWPLEETEIKSEHIKFDLHEKWHTDLFFHKVDSTGLKLIRNRIVNAAPNSSSSSTTTSVPLSPVTPSPTVIPIDSNSDYLYQFGKNPVIKFFGPIDLTLEQIRIKVAKELRWDLKKTTLTLFGSEVNYRDRWHTDLDWGNPHNKEIIAGLMPVRKPIVNATPSSSSSSTLFNWIRAKFRT